MSDSSSDSGCVVWILLLLVIVLIVKLGAIEKDIQEIKAKITTEVKDEPAEIEDEASEGEGGFDL